MRREIARKIVLASLVTLLTVGCASTGGSSNGGNPDLLSREQILGATATNLYDVISRLRPRWIQVRSDRSFDMETVVAVVLDEAYMGGPDVMKQLRPDLAFEIQYLEGSRAATAIPGLMTGQHIQGAILIRTRPVER